MNQLLQEIYSTQSVLDAEGNSINPFPTATSREIGTLFKDFIQKHELHRTIEIGMAYGLSTLFMCEAHREKGTGLHTAIDSMQRSMWKSIGLLNIERANLSDRLRFIQGWSHEVLPELLAKKEKFDFAFIDGSHHFDYTLVDFFYIDKLLEVGGYIAFDDIWMPGVRKVVSYVLRNRDYQLIKTNLKVNPWQGLAKSAKRFLQNPFEQDYQGLRFIPGNICVLKKTAEENRSWNLHRSF